MREIVPDILAWPWFSEPHGYDFNGYLLRHPAGNLCIDPATPSEEVLKEITRLGVSRILLTNRNHARAANRVRATDLGEDRHPPRGCRARPRSRG